MRKIILSCIGVLFIVMAVLFGKKIENLKKKEKPVSEKVIQTVFTDTIQNEVVTIVIPANGSLVAKRRVRLFSEVQGIFKTGKKLFKVGQTYTKGEALIRIDASEYYASVQASKSNLYNAIVGVMPDLKLDFPDVHPKWQAYLKEFNLERTTPKLPNMTSDKENYFITGRGILSSYYNVKNLEQRLAKYVIRAPFTGILTETLVSEGALVRNGQNLGAFIAPAVFEMEVALAKNYADFLKVGAPVTLYDLEGSKSYLGHVSRINGRIDVETQTLTAFIEVKDSRLKEGMYLEARLNAKEEPHAIEIERGLLQEGQRIFVVRDTVLDVLDVEPVYFSETKVVLKGVPNGTVVLKQPVPGAYAGMVVQPYSSKKRQHHKAVKADQTSK